MVSHALIRTMAAPDEVIEALAGRPCRKSIGKETYGSYNNTALFKRTPSLCVYNKMAIHVHPSHQHGTSQINDDNQVGGLLDDAKNSTSTECFLL